MPLIDKDALMRDWQEKICWGVRCVDCPMRDEDCRCKIEQYFDEQPTVDAEPKWTMLKDEMPNPNTNVLVSGIEAINNLRVYKVMVNDNGTLRPTDYAPSIRWDYWMTFECPNCGAKMDLTQSNDSNVLDALDGKEKEDA